MDAELQAKISRLETFKNDLFWWRRADDHDFKREEYRTNINRNKRAVRQLMVDADCNRKVPVRIKGSEGFEEVYADPFDVIFDPLDSDSVVTLLIDMVDETIGVLQDSAAAFDAFREAGPTDSKPELPIPIPDREIVEVIEPPFLDMRLQQGRLELVDPLPESPMKLNRLRDELPGKLAALTKSLADLTEAVKHDNGFLGDLLKTQLVAMLKATVAELEAPQTDTSRLKATARILTGVAVEAGKRGGSEFIKGKLEAVSSSLVEVVKWLWQQSTGQ